MVLNETDATFSTTHLGLASWLMYVLSEDAFVGPKRSGKSVKFVFRDTDPAKSCTYLSQLFWSGAQCSDARELLECSRIIRLWPPIVEEPR
jgi:hypothetical protein